MFTIYGRARKRIIQTSERNTEVRYSMFTAHKHWPRET